MPPVSNGGSVTIKQMSNQRLVDACPRLHSGVAWLGLKSKGATIWKKKSDKVLIP